jgi:hypothetical protein
MTCIIRSIFHIPCPTCGVTRALISLIKGDIKGYCFYNIMALPLCLATIMLIYGDKTNNKKMTIIGVLILVINILYYLIRLVNGKIP